MYLKKLLNEAKINILLLMLVATAVFVKMADTCDALFQKLGI